MTTIPERYFNEIRNSLGYFPTWPIGAAQRLGQVGYFNGREKTFNWVADLKDFGIALDPTGGQRTFDEMYSTDSAVSVTYDLGTSGNPAAAHFEFTKGGSLATQGYLMELHSLPINGLANMLVNRILTGKINWDFNYVILTELFYAKSFSALISGRSGGSISLSAQNPGGMATFNIADVTASITTKAITNMAYHVICRTGTTPYFFIHKVVRNGGRPQLRRYAKTATGFFRA